MKSRVFLLSIFLLLSGGIARADKHNAGHPASRGSSFHGELQAIVLSSGAPSKKQDEAKVLLKRLLDHFDCDYDDKDGDGNPTSVKSNTGEFDAEGLNSTEASAGVTCRNNPADNSVISKTFPAAGEDSKSCAELKCNFGWSVDKAYNDGSGSYLEASYLGRADL